MRLTKIELILELSQKASSSKVDFQNARPYRVLNRTDKPRPVGLVTIPHQNVWDKIP